MGLIITNSANRRTAEQTQTQLAAAQAGQIAERFTTAIEQLGKEGDASLSIRLGAIYELRGLLRDSPADEPAIIDVLSTFIRTHAPWGKPPSPKILDWPTIWMPASPVDVRAAFVGLAYRPHPDQFARVNIAGSKLSFPREILDGADLSGLDLAGAYIGDSSFAGTRLHGTDLSYANLDGADLKHALFEKTDLHGASLQAADLEGLYIRDVDTDMDSANFGQAWLVDVRFGPEVDLRGAIFKEANLAGADFTEVKALAFAGEESHLYEQFMGAKTDANTRFPSYLGVQTDSEGFITGLTYQPS